jgi:hypothetical protein
MAPRGVLAWTAALDTPGPCGETVTLHLRLTSDSIVRIVIITIHII